MKTEDVQIKSVTVYCGSSDDVRRAYLDNARRFGAELVRRGARIVTGAGRTGLMGAVAAGALAEGGYVRGIIPQFMVDRGWHNPALSELTVVPDMHRRKEMMAQTAYACVALPGGIGTFEELMEVITWRQLGLFDGNIVIFNDGGYYDPMLAMIDAALADGFMQPGHSRLYTVAATVEQAAEMALAPVEHMPFCPKFK